MIQFSVIIIINNNNNHNADSNGNDNFHIFKFCRFFQAGIWLGSPVLEPGAREIHVFGPAAPSHGPYQILRPPGSLRGSLADETCAHQGITPQISARSVAEQEMIRESASHHLQSKASHPDPKAGQA